MASPTNSKATTSFADRTGLPKKKTASDQITDNAAIAKLTLNKIAKVEKHAVTTSNNKVNKNFFIIILLNFTRLNPLVLDVYSITHKNYELQVLIVNKFVMCKIVKLQFHAVSVCV